MSSLSSQPTVLSPGQRVAGSVTGENKDAPEIELQGPAPFGLGT